MGRNNQGDWATESRLDRQNSVSSDGWSRLPGDSGYDDAPAAPRQGRRRPARRSWLRSLALPVLVCLVLSGAAIYAMTALPIGR